MPFKGGDKKASAFRVVVILMTEFEIEKEVKTGREISTLI